MFRQLDYQDRVLSTLDAYLDLLKEKKARADKVATLAAQDPDLGLAIPDFAKEAWEAMKAAGKLPASRAAIPFSPRVDGCGRPVPNAVLKVPTGGGKTWLAVSAVSRVMGRYLDRNTGFVLWIVPNEAIYTQTLKHLKDRQHPYRQALDRAAAGRVKIMEKTDRLDARDVETNLCVMLLMLQSANRETQDSLKMFQDRGDVHGFFPPEGEQQAHQAAIDRTPNLSAYTGMFPMVKDSLGNALRVIRPVVVMDEGHRAISDLAFSTLYGFNPCFVLELTATPQDVQPRGGRNPREGRYANVLVEVTGRELDREEMIKMPLNLDPRQGNDWKATLNAALAKLNALDAEARKLRADTGRYIRPIMLIQVERTGADQRESGHIHAEDVKDWLLTAGFDQAEIAIKTAQQNDLNDPENQDLLSPTNRVRAIITKQALQEGWDCPFAYVLCSLAASANLKAMTQLVGRILRQPGALKTGVEALDECHVITHHADTATVVGAIKDGLEQDGLGDLVLRVTQDDKSASGKATRTIKRRPAFATTEIYLPKVMVVEDGEARELDYETDVLAAIDWRGFDPKEIAERIPENAQAAESQLQRIRLAEDGDELFVGETVAASTEVLAFDPAHAVRMISDIVPNPFVGREIVGATLAALRARGFDDAKLGLLASLIVGELRKGLDAARNTRAEALFKAEVAAGRIQFRLRLDGRNWRMPFSIETTEPENARQLLNRAGGPLEKSLFAPVYENELNSDERDVAVYLDGEKTLAWWHRNVARTQYGIQGWKKAKIYPDFIFAVQRQGEAKRITVLETKGDQLDNLDTAYKREALAFLSEHFQWDEATPVGELELVNNGETVEGTLILMSEWKAKLPAYL
ncbi:type III restriction-modification system RcaSBIIP Res subunit [Lampropedia cohaerens]|uniref:Type III restriction-modification system RcaSBIIP Res subunit n=1 Tax=Lampropedia cohaerens TaxID=1610491 RepID=A0A0U1PZF8_9BURK|nr:DEAD/DEAH box helicase family protein [Lampropedia cohaerens]KKW67851.1 type III restriction-modification system RcaSBIIP Res subunit [Lampropedia cohaerens]